ncbi:CxC2 domain-containing protein [Favolaschia claudopus]|uniref:CxC2 domain-containing protein n=1 Tax=Favolaschia claudopus TaxID=2862362 RepID=A0AAV9Z8F0_9AGAR
MSAHSSPNRTPTRSRRQDSFIEYEEKRDDTTQDSEFHSSQDGRRGVRKAVNIQHKQPSRSPNELDHLGGWTPLPENAEGPIEDGAESSGEKRKRYETSDDPMRVWRRLAPLFLDEMLRHEGPGDNAGRCACCHELLEDSRRFRCKCCGMFTQCEWQGSFWARVTLQSLGVVYQLGHGGHPCPHAAPAERSMVVLDFPHIHEIRFRYCACNLSDHANNLQQLLRNGWYPASTVDPATCATFATLDVFRLLNVGGDLTAHDFMRTMELTTDASGVAEVPDRHKILRLVSRQFSFLLRLKRAGRAHDASGLEGTARGECAVRCWACPQEGINLPEGWREVGPEFQFLFMLILAMDANFRLRNRLRPNARDDPPLGSGWGYVVEGTGYKRMIANHVPEKDVSTCIAFAALAQKETRLTTGLRASGVGAVICARHELLRPQGLGDLQKGERYINMDYILLASLMGVTMLYLAIAYDIACQWRVNFQRRCAKFPPEMQLDFERTKVIYGLPVWHATAHERTCQVENSLTYQAGVGRTDGEGTERVWSDFNGAATAMKEMNSGAREDGFEDKVDRHNFEKNVRQGTTLPRKLVIAIDERDRQVAAFEEVDRTLDTSLRGEWEEMIEAWKADRSKKNPYQWEDTKGTSGEAAIRLALAKEELEEAVSGQSAAHKSSASAFVVLGLQLEEHQDRIRREVKGRPLLTTEHNERVTDMRRTFFVKLKRFRRLQAMYMPGAMEQLRGAEEGRDSELPPPLAEDIVLCLPSGLVSPAAGDCVDGLAEKEGRLREGQLHDGIKALRSKLHAKRHLINYREEHLVGQRGGTRAATLIERVTEHINSAVTKYRRARRALISLRGEEECSAYRELEDEHIRLDQEEEPDTAARARLGVVGSRTSKKDRKGRAAASASRRRMSWIWTQGGGPDADDEELVDAVRVEWSRAKARKDRWVEEVDLLREEMRRVLRFLEWRAMWWEQKRSVTHSVSADIRAGLQAYAARQASLARRLAFRFKQIWNNSAAAAVRLALEDDERMAASMEDETVASGEGIRTTE